MKGNTAIANILKMEGTEYLFCFPANLLIEEAAIAGIEPIMSRNERTTVNMADGYTRVSNGRRTGVVVHPAGSRRRERHGRHSSRSRRVDPHPGAPRRCA